MIDLHILSDPVTDFWKFPHKGVFKQMICWHVLHLPKIPLLLPGGRGWDQEGPKGPPGGRRPPALRRS